MLRVHTTHELPDVCTLKSFHPLDTSLATRTALRHALDDLERMEVVRVLSKIEHVE
jgi:hypothetical protein